MCINVYRCASRQGKDLAPEHLDALAAWSTNPGWGGRKGFPRPQGWFVSEGTIRWNVPLGVVPGLAAKGIRNTGSVMISLGANRNGPVVTAGGLVVVGTWPDRTVHAFDKDSGKLLWDRDIDANPEGVPAVYEVKGREYVVFCAWGHPPETAPGEGFAWKAGKPEG
jgi:glucose dehydrogenase